jgi:hypothetical protein
MMLRVLVPVPVALRGVRVAEEQCEKGDEGGEQQQRPGHAIGPFSNSHFSLSSGS